VVAPAGRQAGDPACEGFSPSSVRALARLVAGQGELLTRSPAPVQRLGAEGVRKAHRVRYGVTRTEPEVARKMGAIVTR
jgi:hypothetical protein